MYTRVCMCMSVYWGRRNFSLVSWGEDGCFMQCYVIKQVVFNDNPENNTVQSSQDEERPSIQRDVIVGLSLILLVDLQFA